MTVFEYSVPVVVVGGGATGAAAALAARDAGAEVLLIERDDPPRGSTAMSQGLMCGAGTKAQARAGIEDSPDQFYDDIIAKTKGQTDPVLARAIADEAGPTIDWLIERHGLPLDLDIRFKPSYGHTRSRIHGWIGRSGEDLVQILHQRLAENGVDVLLNAVLVEIVEGPNGVEGVIVERPDGAREAIGCGALIIATSGFGGNHDMVARYMPEAASAYYHGHEGNTGAGIELAERLGAGVGDMGSYQGYGMLADPHGIPLPPGHIVEGGILLNVDGNRFVDEMRDIAGMVHPVLAQPGDHVWAIYDAEVEAKCVYMPETQQLMTLKAVKTADTVEDLATILGIGAAKLAAVLDDAHQAKAAQQPDSTGRLWNEARPPAPSYRAVKVRGALFHTQGGLQIDARARVLRQNGAAFPNLFAGGGAARGVSGPSFWGYLPAMGVCAAVTFGRLAGIDAAEIALTRSTTVSSQR